MQSKLESLLLPEQSPLFPEPGNVKDRYKVGPIIGRGGYSVVRKIKHKKTRIKRALKIIEKADLAGKIALTLAQDMQSFFKEVVLLRQLDHPSIMRVYEFYEDTKFIYLVQQFCEGLQLFEHVQQRGALPELEAARVMKQLLSALNYSHSKKIVHRDLKPENILYSHAQGGPVNFVIKIIDWGTARDFSHTKELRTIIGAPYYIAPEVLDAKYTEKCDLWSAGVILYIMLSGYPPFPGTTNAEIIHNVYKGKFWFPKQEWQTVSQEAKDMITKLLQSDPQKRLSAREALQHEWLAQHFQIDTLLFSSNQEADLTNSPEEKVMNQMKAYHSARGNVVHAMKKLLANHIGVNSERRSELIRVFTELDKDGDGKLSHKELEGGYTAMYGGDQGLKIAEEVMTELDIDNSGFIDYSQFLIATLDPASLLSKKTLRNTFRMLDREGSGFISVAGLKHLLIREKFLKPTPSQASLLKDQSPPWKSRTSSPRRQSAHILLENKRVSPSKLLVRSNGKLDKLLEMVKEGEDQLLSFKQFSQLMHNLFERPSEQKKLNFEEQSQCDSIDIKEFLECEEKVKGSSTFAP